MSKSSHFKITAIVVAVLVVIVALWLMNRPESDASSQTTDDAYIQADLTSIAPRISGVISQVMVRDNQSVSAGQLLFTLDDRDYQIALQRADAGIRSAQATLDSLKAQIERQGSEQQQAQATIDASQADLQLATENRQRFSNLARDGSGTRQAQQAAEANWKTARATLMKNNAALQAIKDQTQVLLADQEKAAADLQQANVAHADALLNLSYCQIKAPEDGIVAQRVVRTGSYAHTGEEQLTLVPLNRLYINANYRETQLANVHPGQSVTFHVDALPGVTFTGKVESLSPASNVSFSPLPAHNASGNFTKIVQRITVRIVPDAGQKNLDRLKVGMSAEPTIQTDNP